MARRRHGDRRGVLLTLLQALARDRADEVRNEAIKPNPPTSAGAKRLGERHDRGLPRSRARPGVSRQSTAWRATTIRRTPGRVWRRSCSPASTTSRPVNARPTHAETSVTVMPLWRGRPPAAAVVRAQRSALRRCLVGGCVSGDTQSLGQGFDARRAGSTNTVARRSAAITRSNSAQSGCVPLAAVKTSRNVCGKRSTVTRRARRPGRRFGPCLRPLPTPSRREKLHRVNSSWRTPAPMPPDGHQLAATNRSNSASSRSSLAAATLARRWLTRVVPGSGTTG